jgi:hypothetical protein
MKSYILYVDGKATLTFDRWASAVRWYKEWVRAAPDMDQTGIEIREVVTTQKTEGVAS